MPQTIGRLLTLVSLLLALGAMTQSSEALRNVKIGDPLPPFSVNGLDGKTYDLAGCKGRPLLLLFVRPGQEGSVTALQTAQQIAAGGDRAAVTILAVSSDDQAGDHYRKVSTDLGLAFPIALDPKRKVYGDFGLVVTPTTLLVDAGGVLRFELPHLPPSYARSVGIHLDLLRGRIDQAAHDEQLKQIRQERDAWNDMFQTRLAFAHTLIEEGKYQDALVILEEIRRQRDAVQVAAELATVYLALDRLDDAAACLQPHLEHEPMAPILNLPLARLELRRGHDEAAERHLNAALKLSPRKGPVLFELGRLHERRGRCDLAVECYRKALEEVYGASK
ncbi:MAG: hypothetical protein C4547_06070 [Phycisphaerales bacterium]|nr:MAG: hypothetical protein C4547_06070 [Phycisphaerales bacterium]